ncbi:MAG: Gldg family protein [Brevinema sp.]
MKKNIVLALIFFGLTLIVSIVSYVFLGERSFFFRISLLLILFALVWCTIYFRKNISQHLRRGKSSRIKLIESLSLLLFFIAFFSLLKSFDVNIDWTARKLFRFSQETKIIVSQIENPLTIMVFSYQEDAIKGLVDYANNLAKRYEDFNPRMVKFLSIDPIRDKIKADEYHIRQNGTIVFEMDGRREFISPNILIESFDDGQISYKGETIFSAVIDKLNNNKQVTIFSLTGHGEIDFDSSGLGGYDGIKTMLVDRRYRFNTVNLDNYPNVPEDTDILIVADPKTELSPQTYISIENYIDGGGNALYLVGRNTISDIIFLLNKSGFAFLPNVAVDPSRTAKNSGEFSIIPTLSPRSEITLLLRNKKQSVIFPSSSVVYSIPEEDTDSNFIYDINPLARMSQYGFGERSFKEGIYSKDVKDITDRYCLAISSTVAEKNNLEKQRRAVVFGSTDFIDNARLYTGGNAELFINSVDFLLRKDLKTTIAPKNENLSQSVPLPEQSRIIVVVVFAWMTLCLIVSIIILIGRKNKVKNQ